MSYIGLRMSVTSAEPHRPTVQYNYCFVRSLLRSAVRLHAGQATTRSGDCYRGLAARLSSSGHAMQMVGRPV